MEAETCIPKYANDNTHLNVTIVFMINIDLLHTKPETTKPTVNFVNTIWLRFIETLI